MDCRHILHASCPCDPSPMDFRGEDAPSSRQKETTISMEAKGGKRAESRSAVPVKGWSLVTGSIVHVHRKIAYEQHLDDQ